MEDPAGFLKYPRNEVLKQSGLQGMTLVRAAGIAGHALCAPGASWPGLVDGLFFGA